MKILVEVELRCKEHERWTAECDHCQLLRRRESAWQRIKTDRVRLMADIKQSLAKGDFIIIDAR